jgi:hypothetical protein
LKYETLSKEKSFSLSTNTEVLVFNNNNR